MEGKLKRYEVDLEPCDEPNRYLYAAPTLVSWFDGPLAVAHRDRGRNLTPREQVEEGFYEFIKGDPMAYGKDCRKLDPLNRHVWELKTTDVRIFGWFPRIATFVMVGGAMRADLTDFASYKPHIDRVVRFRSALRLDEPKALEGGFRDVI